MKTKYNAGFHTGYWTRTKLLKKKNKMKQKKTPLLLGQFGYTQTTFID